MDKSRILPLLGFTSLMVISAAALVLGDGLAEKQTALSAGAKEYTFSFDEASPLYADGVNPSNKQEAIVSSSGEGSVTFLHDGLLASPTAFQRINQGGYIENKFVKGVTYHNRITKITGISYDLSASGIRAYFGIGYNDAVNWTYSSDISGSSSLNVSDEGNFSYIRFVNEGNQTIDIHSLTIEYSCQMLPQGNLFTYSNGTVNALASKPSGLLDVYFPDFVVSTIVTLPNGLFTNYTNLLSVSLPSYLNTIETICFNGVSPLKEIYLPSSIQTIGTFAFYNCPNLERIDCEPASKPAGWSDNLCHNCPNATVNWGVSR